MEQPKENIDNDNKLQKITIKVKIADEGYHDIEFIYDKEDPCNQNLRELFFAKLASVTGIPSSKIVRVLLHARDKRDEYWPCRVFSDRFGLDKLIDGAFYAVRIWMEPAIDGIGAAFCLVPQPLYDEDQCTPDYCQHSNRRSFWNRLVKLFQDSILFKTADGFDYSLFRKNLDFSPYWMPLCAMNAFPRMHLEPEFFKYHRNRG